jgi:hypothetical protein
MAQLFHPSANSFAKASVVAAGLGIVALIFAASAVDRSPYVTRVTVPIPQPIPFSHQHHVAGLGIDCRYCHASVETSAFAGIPAAETCMTCHSQIWRDAPILAPLRDSYARGRSVAWTRVHNLPSYAYFQHDIHVSKGIGCESCHGRVDEMPLTWKASTLHMEWCLNCHREPERYIRPAEQAFTMGYKPAGDQKDSGAELVAKYHVEKNRITDCVTCHR